MRIKQLITSLFIISAFFCANPSIAQSSAEVLPENIIPNPGFEKYSGTPIGWFYKGQHFSNLMKFWSSPTGASPDVFGPKIRVPAHWAEKGFGHQAPHGGESMVGLTLYGCDNGKPHCREYIQIQLSEPLVIGQKYYFEFWTTRLQRSLEINNIGVYFAKNPISIKTDDLLSHKPEISALRIVPAPNGSWTKVGGIFTADQEADYLIIGNFFDDKNTLVAGTGQPDALPYAYYYFDDVLLRKEEPIIDVPVKDDDIRKIPLEVGNKFQLKNIYFDSDKFELLPRSFVEMKKLLNIMHEHPKMIIEVIGHTDSIGRHNYNLYLSRKRAKAVVTFLNENGISKTRTRYKGIGDAEPIETNETDDGRSRNRRVEVLILKL